MPSPFPGMDPYLEDPLFWESFHDRLIFQIGDALDTVLPPGYVAEFRQRVSLVLEARDVVPDVAVLARPPAGWGGTAVAERPDEATLVRVAPAETTERFLEILTVPDHRLVTVIEVASPTNKNNARGREQYREKQRAILASDVHLVELDLLRGGGHWAAVPEDATLAHQPYDYLIRVSRAGRRQQFECHFRTVRQTLPRLAVPLVEPEEVTVDLQAVFDRAYDQGRLAGRLPYHATPRPPLRLEDREWAAALLAAH